MQNFVVRDGEPTAGGFEAGGGLIHELEAGLVVGFVAVTDDRDIKGPAGVESGRRASRRAGSRQAVRGKP